MRQQQLSAAGAESDRASQGSALVRVAEALEAGKLTPAEQRTAAEMLRMLVLPAVRYAERDARIRECRQLFFANRSDNDAAQEIATGLRRYETTAWLRDYSAPECPPRIEGTASGHYWKILRAGGRSLSPERIRKIVGHF